jgi:hypothetical protein
MADSPTAYHPRRAGVRLSVAAAIALLLAGCSASGGGGSLPASAAASPSAAPFLAGSSSIAPTSAASGDARPDLPAGFPVMPGAVAAELPSDSTVIARWTVAEVGSAAYDFYASALPRAGFRVVGLYPAERAALIRLDAPAGAVWQLLAEQVGGETRITVQTDRP